MTPPEIGRLTGYSATTINDYLVGRRCPSRRFLLDLLDKVPLADLAFQEIAPLLGIRRDECPQPSRYRRKPLHEYLSALRVSLRRTRDQFAAKLGVNVDEVIAAEHGRIPDLDYLNRLSRVLPASITVESVVAVFPVLRPTPLDNKLRRNLEKARLHPTADPQRKILENALAADLVPEARRMALNAAWKIRRPEYAEEVWGEAVALTIRRHDPQKGLMLAYLNTSIHGLIRALAASNRHTGTATIIRDYGETVREAEVLFSRLGRRPSDDEVAAHTDLRASLIGEVQRARSACVHVGGDELDFLLQEAVDIPPSESAGESELVRRLRDMPEDWREIIYLHFHDRLPLAEIKTVTDLAEDAILATIDAAVTLLRGDPAAGRLN
ncbi:DNA-directed RNA polymerase specialized sigma subunit [Pseudosporangium ferrugineum]|uniref:DNA-directed RNA polymerase specialized sigma subunit n=1 Tax=Pseudosporangium ferrugineum TaxID=439699 RepID=A0A2T0RCM4_9ACTN|nr:DNA-directed RNA polymerase specialized sigma subunit [Pseudosporangium ferrugineum]